MYLGPEFSPSYIRNSLVECDCDYQELNEELLIELCVNDLACSLVVGWFQSKFEWGQHAPGNRSILAGPTESRLTEKINIEIKSRETLFPFASSVLIEFASDYFEYPPGIDMSYMPYLAKAKAVTRELAPAAVHFDGTSRVQTVSYEQNPRYWKLIAAFGQRTGLPMVLNTSFNVKGEPIVATPEEALTCFGETNIDVLYLGNFRITKKGAMICWEICSAREERIFNPLIRNLHV